MERVNPRLDERKTPTAPGPGPLAGPGDVGAAIEHKHARPDAVGSATEVRVDGRGRVWWARVVGRSGRARVGTPLLLLGFRAHDEAAPTLEALVAGRSLEGVPVEALESALARAVPPVPAGRRRPFFEDAGDARRT